MKEFFNGDTRERKYNQTAVEWLFEQLDISQGYESAIKILEQAKEMENERLTEAYRIGRIGKSIKEFNETFKSE
jgi:hypothetical protein